MMIRHPPPDPALAALPTAELLAEIDHARARILEAGRHGRQAEASVQRLADSRAVLLRRFQTQKQRERRTRPHYP